MDRLVERFDKKDPKVYFRELAQLKQTGGLEYSISDFQRLSVMVSDISDRRLVVLFIEGLSEPLKGWVKAFDPFNLQEAIKKARSMEHATPTNKFQSKGASSSKDNKPFFTKTEKNETETENKDKLFAPLDRETLNDLRNKKLCFYCKGPYDMNHDCPLRPKGKANRVMWAFYEDSDSENSEQQTENEESSEEKENLDDEKFKQMSTNEGKVEGRLKEACLTSVQQEGSFRMRGVVAGQRVITLLDTGATHNFIDSRLVERCGIQTEQFEGLRVRVVDGFVLKCDRKITKLPLKINNYDFKTNFYVVNMGDTDLVLGMTWLHDVGEFTLNLREMEMRFQLDGKTHILKAIQDSEFKMMSCRRMESLLRHNQVEWSAVMSPFLGDMR